MSTELKSVRVLSKSETKKLVGISDRTWDRMEARGDTPRVTQISERRVGYRVIDIEAWLDARRVGETAPVGEAARFIGPAIEGNQPPAERPERRSRRGREVADTC